MARSSTTYPKKWNSAKTTVIRVPEVMADQLLHLARRLDSTGGFRLREELNSLVLDLVPAKKVEYVADQPINVSSVPQRSPFRYPGGKTWLVPYVRDWLRSCSKKPIRLIEPFAGGAIISLTAAFENLAKHVIFSELDSGVAAVWRIILNGQSEWLVRKILDFDLSEEAARQVLQTYPVDLRDKAFQTILRNRVQRGGIMAPGAGLVKTGENGKGISSRWYPETLARRIREINCLKDRLTFVEGDGFNLIREQQADVDAVFYIDPPYTQAARRLYANWEIDQERLFRQMKECKGDFLMSYDNTVEVLELAKKFGFESRPVAMKNTHHAKMTELLIGRDLSWLKS
ncbi:MAG: DNA adenine methylase [Methylacidiphilales bacterium]|nr:DNA adenine methylase [Candidatus Methylacidiphilales bacterium]